MLWPGHFCINKLQICTALNNAVESYVRFAVYDSPLESKFSLNFLMAKNSLEISQIIVMKNIMIFYICVVCRTWI